MNKDMVLEGLGATASRITIDIEQPREFVSFGTYFERDREEGYRSAELADPTGSVPREEICTGPHVLVQISR